MTSLIKSACCAVCLLGMHAVGAKEPDLVPAVSAKQEYRARVDDKDWSAAVSAAQARVAAARKDAEPVPLAEALGLLGNAQFRNADLAGAEASFKEALELVVAAEGRASALTLTPLRGLGFTLAAGNRHAEAVPYLDRALLITHRTYGLFYQEQQSILQQLANSLTYSGQPLEAERHINYMLQVGERAYGKDSPKLVPLMCQAGDWRAEIGDFDKARRHYRDAIRLVEDQLGKKHVAIVRPLRRLAASYPAEMDFYAEGFIDPYTAQTMDSVTTLPHRQNPRYVDTHGQRALLRALRVLESQPEPPQELLVATLVDLGDWYEFRQDSDKALPFYARAAKLIEQMKRKAPETAHDPLAFPVRVYYPVPHVIARGNRLLPEQREEAFVQLQLDVLPDGTVENVVVTDTNTHQRHVSEIIDAMRDARFRPKFEHGEPVETTAMSFREVYPVRGLPERDSEDPS